MTAPDMIAGLSAATQYLAVRWENDSALIDPEIALGKFADLLGGRRRNSSPLRLYRLPPKRYTSRSVILDVVRLHFCGVCSL
jgi:hypothetical protein